MSESEEKTAAAVPIVAPVAAPAAADAKAPDETAKVDEAEIKAEERVKTRKENNELTKRLQSLALVRQKESKGERLKVIQSDTGSHLSSIKTFQELNLPKSLLDALFAMGFDRPSAIQEEALPRILADPPRNLIGQAQSGSGKTAAFTVGMLFRIQVDNPPTVQALCVTPTRELAIQIVDKAVRPMGANMAGLKVQLALAGVFPEKGKKLDAHLVVGTPGKVVDWLKRKYIDTKTVKVFVLDEADNMVEENGHRANSLLIKKQMPKQCQCLLFSATFTPEVVKFASKMVYNPDKILIEDGPEFLVRVCRRCSHLSLAFVLTRARPQHVTSSTPVWYKPLSHPLSSPPTLYRYSTSLSNFGSIHDPTTAERSPFWRIFTRF